MSRKRSDRRGPAPGSRMRQGEGSRPGIPAAEPEVIEPGAAEPRTAEPGAVEPGAAEPGAAEPGAAEPGAAEPGAAEPGAAESAAGEQPVGEPAGEPAAGERAPDRRRSPAERPPGAPEIYRALETRLRRECPGWQGRPEDPARILLELWAELAAELHGEIYGLQERISERLLEAMEAEPRGPYPASGAVRFLPAEAAPARARRVPAGTRVSTARDAGGIRIVFETVEDCWAGAPPPVRAYSLSPEGLRLLPAEWTGGPRMETPFGDRTEAGRLLYLGDSRLETLRDGPGPIAIEWVGLPLALADAVWEYRWGGGWRALHPRFEAIPGGGPGQALLRMWLHGPLPGLEREEREEAVLPWIRARLAAKEEIALAAPCLRGPGAPEASAAARLFVESGAALEDLSFSSEPAVLGGRPDALDPCLLLGFAGPHPVSLYLECGAVGEAGAAAAPREALADWNPSPPRLEWEVSGTGGWIALEPERVRDRTAALGRSGSIHLEPPPGWEPLEVLGERLYWARARWCGGSFLQPPSIQSLQSGAVEVIQGITRGWIPLAPRPAGWSGWIEVPDLPEGSAAPFDRVMIEAGGGRTVWERAAALTGSPGQRFLLRRRPNGALAIRFDDPASGVEAPPPGAAVRIEGLRAIAGAAGNLPPGSLREFEPPLEGIRGVEQIGSTRGGSDLESRESLRRRSSASLLAGGERAVTAADHRRLARALLPGSCRISAGPDPHRPGGILVAVLGPGEEQPAPGPALRWSLERYLSDKAPPGIPVRVVEGIAIPAVLAVELERERLPRGGRVPGGGQEEDLARWIGSVVRGALEPGAEAGAGPGPAAGRPHRGRDGPVSIFPYAALEQEPLEPLLARALGARDDLSGMRLVKAVLTAPGGPGGNRTAGLPAGPGAFPGPAAGLFIELRKVVARIKVPK